MGAVAVAEVPPEMKGKFDARVKQLEALSADPHVVDAVKAYNASTPSPEAASMTNEKWHELNVFDPLVRSVYKAPLSEFLRAKRDDVVIKMFVSGANGGKVAFDAKTEFWMHKGMPKHDLPMQGKVWTGPLTQDHTTGQQMIQIGFPVLDHGKPIGSVVFGMRADKLR
ncbi:MAG: PDC sensor domain-containing protein [Acidobacteriia bacterium]|nr:PDC sensor domain-containing protein [Terriglobia bacterium]